jgi:nicotinate dehydrogenase subunit A
MAEPLEITVNGERRKVETDRRRMLLYVLREDLQLTGTKYGCGESECGACTVLVEGKAVRSCVTAVERVAGKSITTIEGLAAAGKLHPIQQAFIDEGALQCGYCVPGMIMNAAALLSENPSPTRDEIVKGMDGNICRCTNYIRILAAIERAAKLTKEAKA